MLGDAPLAETAAALRSGELSVSALFERTEERIDDREHEIAAFVGDDVQWGRVRERTDALEARYPDPSDRPPLFGVPVGIKDIINVDGLPTRAGSALPAAAFDGPQADVVTALQDAGAIVLGKTVTTEFAYSKPGPTRNPHDPNHTPGGSSSGSAAAVASGMCPLALGTQTGGSVVRPAAFCGVVGVKPSFGRLPTDGVLRYAESLDHVGFFTQDIPGARLAGESMYERWTEPADDSRPRIGVPADAYLSHASDAGRAAFERHLEALSTAGFEVERTDVFDEFPTVFMRHQRLKAAEAVLNHYDRFERYGERYSDVMTEQLEVGRSVRVDDLATDRAKRIDYRDAIEDELDDRNVDLLVSPPAPGPAPEGIDSTGDPIMNLPWTYVGLPTATVPAGTVDGLPVGLQCSARYDADEQLLAWLESIRAALPGLQSSA
ncbi:amidase [Natronorubrum sp. FCH18a]|uniref:amidase n=1 Tax=Natronorubrum sp. FCH18a TaxID=3447018 RepID=UPI003F519B75